MTGIVGIISHDRRLRLDPQETDDLARAYEALRGPGRRHHAIAGDYARVIKIDNDNGDPPGIQSDHSGWAAATGVVHYPGSLVGVRPHHLDGQFGLVSYDERLDELVVATDPFGMYAIYIAERDDKTYVSTSSLALAKHLRAQPSRLGLSTFLLIGAHFGTTTNWEGIHRLEPGTFLRFQPGGHAREVYWRPEIDTDVARLSFEEACGYCAEIAIDTYRKYFPSESGIWCDLTGGYDTRLLVLLLRSAGLEFRTNTNGQLDDDDVRLAEQIVSITGWEWLHLTPPDDWAHVLPTLLPIALGWGDANLDVLVLSYTLWAHKQKRHIHPALLIAGGGEHFQYYAWQTEFHRAGRSNQVNLDNWVNMRLMSPPNSSIFSRDPSAEVRDDLRKRMETWVKPYSSELNTTQLDILYAYKSTGHFGMYCAAAGAFLRAELPFYSKNVFTAAFSTNYKFRNHHRLMRNVINHLDPAIAAIPTTKGGPAQPWRLSNAYRFVPYYALIARKAVNKLSPRTLGRALLLPRPSTNPRVVRGRRSLIARFSKEGGPLAFESMRTAPLFRRGALADLLSRGVDANFADTALLGRLITVELALRATDASIE